MSMSPTSGTALSPPTVYVLEGQFDIAINSKPEGRVVFRLFDDVVPRTAQNFRELATGQHGFGYAESSFHRIIPDVCNFSATPKSSIRNLLTCSLSSSCYKAATLRGIMGPADALSTVNALKVRVARGTRTRTHSAEIGVVLSSADAFHR